MTATHPTLTSVRVRVERVHTDGTYTRVTCLRGGPGPAFVLVPGIGMGVGIFERLAPRLLPHGDVFALDLPGFAGIRTHDRALSIADYARLVDAALEHLHLDDPVVIGHSMGTQVVTELAASRPGLSRIVLISPVVAPQQRAPLRVVGAFLLAALHEPIGVTLLAGVSYVLTGLRSFAATLPRMLAYRMEDRIADVDADTLIVRGEYDTISPRSWIDTLVRRAPTASAREVSRAAHSVMHGHAEAVARLCVVHAGAEEAVDPPPVGAGRWTLRLSAYALAARLREITAILRGDDTALERAKTSRVRVALAAGDVEPAT
ncbi:alpha/beta fold hydrolase [Microbacterium koreense]|uniref:Alpha/beta fold hydrolase n=1 Tax=Microbacterium koreense TaxID=323761 RepID=A0ABW2ZP54_9MICO